MRIVISGGAGFIGSHLCDRFLSEGHEVIALDNLITGSADNVAQIGHPAIRLDDPPGDPVEVEQVRQEPIQPASVHRDASRQVPGVLDREA